MIHLGMSVQVDKKQLVWRLEDQVLRSKRLCDSIIRYASSLHVHINEGSPSLWLSP